MSPTLQQWRACTVAADVAAASRADARGLAERRRQRLVDLLRSAAKGSRLYRKLLKGCRPEELTLQDLPITRKSVLMRHFDDWVTDPEVHLDDLHAFIADRSRIAQPFLGRYVVWESSGSSGEPGIFIQDDAAMAVYDAIEALRRPVLRPLRRMLDPWYMRERIVFVGAVDGHFASTVTIERLRRLNPAVAGNLHSVSFLQPTHSLVAELQALAPTIVTTYPSAAVLLAEERHAGRLNIAPQEIWTGGETLAPAMRSFIQDVFECPVVDSYGASEFLPLAIECRWGGLHLNSDWVILESVDEHGRAVAPDHAGATTLLTNLANHVQPLIRYDLGDQVTVHAQECACGSHLPVIDVCGRSDDTLHVKGRGGRAVKLLPLALSTLLEQDAGLYDFQVVQQGPCDLLLRTEQRGASAVDALRRARDVLGNFLEQEGATGVHIHCHSGQVVRRGRSGKVQRVVCKTG